MKRAYREQIEAIHAQAEAERLAEGAAAGHRIEDHQPGWHDTPSGWALGCTCGKHAGKRSARMSMDHVWFARHVKDLGLPLYGGGRYPAPIYMDGPAKGLTWNEADARGIDING